jgi:hypothetical protein
MIWLLPHHPLHSISRQKARPAIHRKTKNERHLTDGRGGGGGAKYNKGEKSLVLYKSFNTLRFKHNISVYSPPRKNTRVLESAYLKKSKVTA